jgi:putative transposase
LAELLLLWVSNDNPYSEAQFKTLKYLKESPLHFGSDEDARGWVLGFLCWNNHRWINHWHCHSRIGLMSPALIHHGLGEECWEERRKVLVDIYRLHPEHFFRGEPHPHFLPRSVWIYPPRDTTAFRSPEKGAKWTDGEPIFV